HLNSFPMVLAGLNTRLAIPSIKRLNEEAPATPNSGDQLETGATWPLLGVQILLVDENMLFGQARRRAWLFGLLIVAAAIVALFGLTRTLQALTREQRLNEMKTNF